MRNHHPIDTNATWVMDFQFDETGDGKVLILINAIEEYLGDYPAT